MEKGIKINDNGFQCGAQMTCPRCGNKDMDGHGGSFGGRITTYKRKCPECECVLLIVPMKKDYSYSITAETEQEQDARYEKRTKLRELEEQVEKLRNELRIG